MFYTIYQITNLLDGKIYIGKHQTKDLADAYMGSGILIQKAIKKYGLENFKKEILFQFETEVDMNAKEAELVNEEFVARSDTYNICFGGQGGFGYINTSGIRRTDGMLGKKHTEKTRKQISEAHKNNPETLIRCRKNRKDYRDKLKSGEIQNGMTGRKHSEASRRQMSESGSGSNNSQFGKHRTAETKKKISEKMLSLPKIECYNCGFQSTNKGTLNRWHNDNCKRINL